LQAFLGGAYVNQFNRFGRQWKVYLQAEPEYRISADKINSFYVRTRGRNDAAASMVTVKRVSGPEYTTASICSEVSRLTAHPPRDIAQARPWPRWNKCRRSLACRYGICLERHVLSGKKAEGGQAIVFGMSIFCVFLILAALYESWSLPFSVLLSVPVAVLGANAGLLLRKLDNNVFAQIGLVMLIGLTARTQS